LHFNGLFGLVKPLNAGQTVVKLVIYKLKLANKLKFEAIVLGRKIDIEELQCTIISIKWMPPLLRYSSFIDVGFCRFSGV